MIRSLRRSFAAKLIAGGCVLALIVVGGVAAYLIYSRTAQTRATAESNSDNRVGVMKEVLARFTAAEAESAAAGLVAQPGLQQALGSRTAAAAVGRLFAGGPSVDIPGEVLLVTDSVPNVLYVHASAGVAPGVASFALPPPVTAALGASLCHVADGAAVAGGCGVEVLSNGEAAFVVALPVVAAGHPVGVVAVVAPLAFQLNRFQALFGYTTAFVPASNPRVELRTAAGVQAPTDAGLAAAFAHRASLYTEIYPVPLPGGGTQPVAGSFVPVAASDGRVTGFIGVEVPLAQFVGDERTDILVVSLIALFVILVVAITVVLFVERFVKRPIARLERGVARIAGGDYTTGIQVRSRDELGRLAANVNRMRDAIAGYINQVEQDRHRLDVAMERLSGVSLALTTTASGVRGLEQAVVRTAASIAGGLASSLLAVRDGQALVPVASEGQPLRLEQWDGLAAVLRGETVHLTHPEHGLLVAVPMFYQDRVVGSLMVMRHVTEGAAADRSVDVDVLAVLANNAAIAMENARLFEQERETVRRLRELDSLKTDFLATIQHELRTPLTAILALSDLLEMCWNMWEEEPKLEAVRNIQVAARNLYDIVETIIEYSALESDNLALQPRLVPVRATVEQTVELLGERYKGGLPVPVDIEGDARLVVMADADKLSRVLRAVLDNAVKFSEGRGTVRVLVASAEGGGAVRIEIADEGVGIAEEDLPHVFDRFYQVDNTATRSHGGTGMGLALVQRMVEAHGARVEVSSVAGKGTRVVLTWPARAADDPGEGGRRGAAPAADPATTTATGPALPVQ